MSARDELRALAEKATPGPWDAYFTLHGDPLVVEGGKGIFHSLVDPVVRPATCVDDYGRANCQFIAAANPAVILALLDELDVLRARVVVAEEASVVAYEDADRLAEQLEQRARHLREPGQDGCTCGTHAALAAHAAAVSSRPKGDSDGA